MRISARADYALRACIELARADDTSTSDVIAQAQGISQLFVQRILGDMRQAGYVDSTRGGRGGYRLARRPDEVTVADVVRAMDGPLVRVHGLDPDELSYPESTGDLAVLWTAVRACLETLLEGVTLEDLATGRLPAHLVRPSAVPESAVLTSAVVDAGVSVPGAPSKLNGSAAGPRAGGRTGRARTAADAGRPRPAGRRPR